MAAKPIFMGRVGDDVALTEQACEIAQAYHGRLPTTSELSVATREFGINLATKVLLQAIDLHSKHGPFCQEVNNMPLCPRPVADAPLLVIVPGLGYREHPEIGADGALITDIAGRFGIDTVIAPTMSKGSIERTRIILHDFLLSLQAKPFWLISLSRGSAEVKWLLGANPGASYLKYLENWISVAGVVSGSPQADHATENFVRGWFYRFLARLGGIDAALIAELQSSRPEWQPTVCPTHVRCINIIAAPMSWDITHRVQARYKRIAALGPNDGAVLLGDYLREPGLFLPLAGTDHLMRSNRIAALFYRLINYLLVPANSLNRST